MERVAVRDILIGPDQPLAVICGPCVIEGEEHTLQCAEELKKLFEPFGLRLIFKASYDKANRSSISSFRGPGLQEGLRILERAQKEVGLPVVTDVHSPNEATAAGAVCDMIQIPAFLSRQTDLILAAGKTPAAINVKKGQFLAPWDMKNVVEKLLSVGCRKIILTDRGTSFGYNNLVSDFRTIPIMQGLGFPVCFDASHSVQLPGGMGASSGGQREFIPVLAKAAIAAGANALFIEAHPTPATAKSDAASVLSFQELKALLPVFEKLYDAVQIPCLAK
ncbi:MAG: 3-deoxy-8-phosphooctulonate synthase [Verrucomicrobiota bacterium]|nr:3-deoxy-8-phosphooctulonate synthase [Verrucomicrobiota bacterium]